MKSECKTASRLVEYLDGDMSAEEAARVAEHLSQCSECRTAAGDLKASLSAFKALTEAECKTGEGRSIAAAVMSEVRVENGGRRSRRWLVAAAAAAILIIFVASNIHFRKPRVNIEAERAVAEVPNGLTVKLQPDSFELEDRFGGVERNVYVAP